MLQNRPYTAPTGWLAACSDPTKQATMQAGSDNATSDSNLKAARYLRVGSPQFNHGLHLWAPAGEDHYLSCRCDRPRHHHRDGHHCPQYPECLVIEFHSFKHALQLWPQDGAELYLSRRLDDPDHYH